MGITVAKEYAATAKGSEIKHVTCEKCDESYVYTVTRKVKGHGATVGFADGNKAQKRAREKARKTLASELDKAIEPVPCVGCSWLQADMVREAKRRYYRWLWRTGFVIAFVAALVLIVILANRISHKVGSVLTWAWIAFSAGVVIVAVRTAMLSKYDPNSEQERWPSVRKAA